MRTLNRRLTILLALLFIATAAWAQLSIISPLQNWSVHPLRWTYHSYQRWLARTPCSDCPMETRQFDTLTIRYPKVYHVEEESMFNGVDPALILADHKNLAGLGFSLTHIPQSKYTWYRTLFDQRRANAIRVEEVHGWLVNIYGPRSGMPASADVFGRSCSLTVYSSLVDYVRDTDLAKWNDRAFDQAVRDFCMLNTVDTCEGQGATRSGSPSNKGVNLTVRPVTRLAGLLPERGSHGRAQGARPSRPAGYAWR